MTLTGCSSYDYTVPANPAHPSVHTSHPRSTIGLVLLAVAVVRHRRFQDEPERDERTQKIGAYGISYSWLLTIIFLALLFWVNYLGLLALTVETVLLTTILLMGLSARIFQWYFFRQGDVA